MVTVFYLFWTNKNEYQEEISKTTIISDRVYPVTIDELGDTFGIPYKQEGTRL